MPDSTPLIVSVAAFCAVVASARDDGLNFDLSQNDTINGKTCVIAGSDDVFLTEIYDDLTEGRYPAKEDEILLSHRAKERLSLNICCRFVVELSDFLGYTDHTEPYREKTAQYNRAGWKRQTGWGKWMGMGLAFLAAPCWCSLLCGGYAKYRDGNTVQSIQNIPAKDKGENP